jgi:hypothetical protein
VSNDLQVIAFTLELFINGVNDMAPKGGVKKCLYVVKKDQSNGLRAHSGKGASMSIGDVVHIGDRFIYSLERLWGY